MIQLSSPTRGSAAPAARAAIQGAVLAYRVAVPDLQQRVLAAIFLVLGITADSAVGVDTVVAPDAARSADDDVRVDASTAVDFDVRTDDAERTDLDVAGKLAWGETIARPSIKLRSPRAPP